MNGQRTIASEAVFSGKALQTGREASVICRPASAGAGIIFNRTDLPGSSGICLSDAVFSADHARRSVIGEGAYAVQTVEHFLAALWALGIDNLSVEVDGPELPAMDGSALEFFRILESAGSREQSLDRGPIVVLEEERVEDGDRSITAIPADIFSVLYLIDYPCPSIGRETFDISLDRDTFEREIAPARTFCLKAEADALIKAGLGKGATLENTLVMGEDGPVGTALRFPNEPVRHKVLDLVGDLYMLGRPLIGRFIAEKSGHALNGMMVRKIYEKYVKNTAGHR
jgi:UDP-3-O-acyl N-acetylglucosamine deacetylase